MNSGLSAIDAIEADERVDLEIGEVKLYIDGIDTGDEVSKSLLLFSIFYVRQQSRFDRLSGWETDIPFL